MLKCLSKILLIVISLSFFISATEMNVGGCSNTFFDEYDTYVKAEQPSIDHAPSIEQNHDAYALIGFLLNQYQAFQIQLQIVQYSNLAYYNKYPVKLFLRNSVWRI